MPAGGIVETLAALDPTELKNALAAHAAAVRSGGGVPAGGILDALAALDPEDLRVELGRVRAAGDPAGAGGAAVEPARQECVTYLTELSQRPFVPGGGSLTEYLKQLGGGVDNAFSWQERSELLAKLAHLHYASLRSTLPESEHLMMDSAMTAAVAVSTGATVASSRAERSRSPRGGGAAGAASSSAASSTAGEGQGGAAGGGQGGAAGGAPVKAPPPEPGPEAQAQVVVDHHLGHAFVQENDATEETKAKARRAKTVQDKKRETVRRILERMLNTQAEVTKLDMRLDNEDMYVPSIDRLMETETETVPPVVQESESVYIHMQRLRDARDERLNDIKRFRAEITLMIE